MYDVITSAAAIIAINSCFSYSHGRNPLNNLIIRNGARSIVKHPTNGMNSISGEVSFVAATEPRPTPPNAFATVAVSR